MKRYIVKIFLFFGLVVLIDYVFGQVCQYMFSHPKGGETRNLHYLVKECDRDIVVMGSSRAHCHYDDKMIEDSVGLTCYNAGVEGNGIIMMYGLYKLMEHKPQMIIYDVEPSFDCLEYAEDQHNTRYVSVLKFFKGDVVDEILAQVSPSLVYKNKSNLYRYNTRFITVAKDFLRGSGIKQYGFDPALGEMSEEPVHNEEKKHNVDETKVHFVKKFIEETSKDGVKVIFVASPKYGYDGNSLEPIKKVCKQAGIPFFDYSDDERFKRLDFFKEPMHMNENGAREFSSMIIDLLSTNNIN